MSALAALLTAVVALVGIFQFGTPAPAATTAPAGPPSASVPAGAGAGSVNATGPAAAPSIALKESPMSGGSATDVPRLSFSELGGLLSTRADAVGAPVGQPIAEYITVRGSGLSAAVPSLWDMGSDAAAPWVDDNDRVVGSSVVATPNVEHFFGDATDQFDAPGLFLAASRELAVGFQSNALLDQRVGYYSAYCQLTDHGELADRDYSGRFELYTDCAGRPMLALNVELLADAGDHVVDLHFRVVSQADPSAANHLLSSFEVDAAHLLR